MIKRGVILSAWILIPIFVALQTLYFIRHEQNIYFWDFNGYWRSWENFVALLKDKPNDALNNVALSVMSDDYNILPIVIPALLSDITLSSRLLFIELLNLLYLVPVIYLFHILCINFTEKNRTDNLLWHLTTLFIPLFFVPFWAPSLKGYPDISGLIFVLAAVILSAKVNFSSKVTLAMPVLLGLILWGPFLFRRWYAFTVVSLYFSIPLFNYYIFNGLKLEKKKIFNLLANFTISGLLSCGFVLYFQHELFERILHTDYANIYQAYQASIGTAISTLAKGIGVYLIPFFALGLTSAFYCKDKKEKGLIYFSLFNLVFSFFLFTKTQAPGVQHCLPFSLWILIICTLGIKFIMSKIRKKRGAYLFIALFLGMHGYIFGISVNHTTRFYPDWCKKLLPTKSYPLLIDNYDNYLNLVNDLSKLTENGKKVTVFASNGVLNDDMLNTISGLSLSKSLSYASQVDLRDGMRIDSLMSDYFVVTSPPQIHLKSSGQQVITVPVEQILNGKSIGNAMVKLNKNYILANGVNAVIYERVRPYKPEEVDQFFTLLFKSYPQWNGVINKGLPFTYLSTQVEAGDQWGSYSISYDGKVGAHPGENTPTIFSWNLRGVNRLNVKSVNTSCQNADGVDVSISAPGHQTKTIHVDNGKSGVIQVADFKDIESKLIVSKHLNSACDSIEISSD